MKQLITTLIFIIGFAGIAKADTIDYWCVYYNNVKINNFNANSELFSGKPNEITLKIKDIKETDSLTIKYYRDWLCYGSNIMVKIENKCGNVITKGVGTESPNPIKVSVLDLLLKYETDAAKHFFAYYYEYCEYFKIERTLLFEIKLE